jgi:glycerate dehydrogenase
MACLKVVFLDEDTFSTQTSVRTPAFEHAWISYPRSAPHEVAQRIADADIVITNKVKLGAELLAGAKKLKLIAVAATGTDVIDLQAATQQGIIVSNIRNYAKHTVPEHTFALIFTLRRSIKAYHDAVRAGRWLEADQFCFFDYPIKDLAGSTLGIIGDGALGQQVAQIASAFGMRVLFSAHKGRTGMGALYTPFEEVLAQSDVITLHCPLRPSTRNMISTDEFALMKRKPLLINTARGGLVDEAALVEALRQGQVGGAGFDVTSTEPMPKDHPFNQIMDAPNFILTPHVAWASDEAVQGLADQLVDNIEAFVRGEPRNIVQPLAK